MGEVYRADDLKLAQPVALKFLPRSVATEPAALARFHNEVRVARQVSHPNVCRIYDLSEADGQHFLSMEYIDGEDLSSLLRRIGRLPADKAVQSARQLCAGLAAAHDLGVLHRDLKPANVMLDGRGTAKIMDFGLADFAEQIRYDDIAGTPAYMAPEQLAGGPATISSDLYALGLVLFEMFTGAPAFAAGSAADRARASRDSAPPTPSQARPDIDPAVERVIVRCLERDPARRPPSARVDRGGASRRRSARGRTRRGRDSVAGDGRGRRDGWQLAAGGRLGTLRGAGDRTGGGRGDQRPRRCLSSRARPALARSAAGAGQADPRASRLDRRTTRSGRRLRVRPRRLCAPGPRPVAGRSGGGRKADARACCASGIAKATPGSHPGHWCAGHRLAIRRPVSPGRR